MSAINYQDPFLDHTRNLSEKMGSPSHSSYRFYDDPYSDEYDPTEHDEFDNLTDDEVAEDLSSLRPHRDIDELDDDHDLGDDEDYDL